MKAQPAGLRAENERVVAEPQGNTYSLFVGPRSCQPRGVMCSPTPRASGRGVGGYQFPNVVLDLGESLVLPRVAPSLVKDSLPPSWGLAFGKHVFSQRRAQP